MPLSFTRAPRVGIAVGLIGVSSLILLFGREDPAPRLNAAALTLAQEPQFAERATALLEDSLRLNPDQEIARFNLGWLTVVTDPPRAEANFVAAAKLVPDKGGVYFGLGLARMNQGNTAGAAEAFALECLNDPAFLRSPWWKLSAIAAHREATWIVFLRLLDETSARLDPASWAAHQIPLLHERAATLGEPLPGPENAYRRERTGYPVLTRNFNFPPPVDLFDVRENALIDPELPPKGWLPSPLLLSLLDPALGTVQ